MKYWLISDTHLGHDKMLDYCQRPKGFETKILNHLANIMNLTDTLIHLGDVCIGKDAYWNKEYISACKFATNILVRGNHDKNSNSWYQDIGWDFVCNTFTLQFYGKNILFSHRPIDLTNISKIDINIHGHSHNTKHRESYEGYLHKLVYIEHHYQPITLAYAVEEHDREVKKRIKKEKICLFQKENL